MTGRPLKMAYIFNYHIRKIDILNEKDAHNISSLLVDFYMFINAHARYYIGAIIGMLIDKKGWTSKKHIVKHLLVVLMLSYLSVEIMHAGGLPEHVILLIASIVGFTGHSTARYVIDDSLPQVLKALTDKIINIIGNK